ncbi:MAG TPA: hypothetical protein VFI11_02425 [Anaerolineales bacterium]|nr:hypothetical protein [Anaerolineales bacterium]
MTLACSIDLGGPEIPDAPAASESSAQQVEDAWQGALAGAVETGQLTILFDEAQLTSLLAERFAGEPGGALESPVVLLREGAIQVFGVGHQGPLRANIHLTITPVLSQDGELGFELTSAEFGPLPLPEGLRERLSAVLTEALSGPLGTRATGVRITSVAIDSGELAIVGELR